MASYRERARVDLLFTVCYTVMEHPRVCVRVQILVRVWIAVCVVEYVRDRIRHQN